MSDLAASADIEWPFTFSLRKPVAVPGGEIEELILREPTTADFLDLGIFDGASGSTMVDLIVRLSGKPAPVIKAIPGLEISKLVRRLSDFFGEATK